jgi:uncharacterized membrane protein YraQ (UPF0718 family)
MLKEFTDWLVFTVFGISEGSHLGESLHFFVYDTIKILILLFLMISVVGFLRTYLPQHKIKRWLTGRRLGFGNVLAALFGAVTPFCSCSSIPIFISFLEAGIPLGVTFSFLITSPLINEYVVIIMWGFFGWKITLLYVLFGLFVGIFSGLILGKMKLEKHLEKDLIAKKAMLKKEVKHDGLKGRIRYGVDEALSIIKKIWMWVLIGVGLGAVIHGFVPEETIQSIISKGGIFTVPIATILGVPLYANCSAVVPIAVVLFEKGIPLGTALAFMMATAALSFPEAVILRRVMKLKLIAIFFGIVTLGIIFIGYMFNMLQVIL